MKPVYMREIRPRELNERKVLIIAEAGVNHNGSLELAKKMVKEAARAGADFIKFQTFKTELNISKAALKASYQIENSRNAGESQYDMVRKLELGFGQFRELKEECILEGIGFSSTGFDLPSLDFLDELGVPFFKIPSGEIINKPYLAHIARKGQPVILSTGMANLGEIEAALDVLLSGRLNRDQITLLHCNTEYPTPMADVNLRAMKTLRKAFQVKVGYSDHTAGIEVPIAAVALGACVIEKHFTLDRTMEGPDHKASLEPDELAAMVRSIRNIEKALGNGRKEPSPSEIPNKAIARKSLHLAHDMKKGERLGLGDLSVKRPGDGISPMLIDLVTGRCLASDLPCEHKLDWTDLSA